MTRTVFLEYDMKAKCLSVLYMEEKNCIRQDFKRAGLSDTVRKEIEDWLYRGELSK